MITTSQISASPLLLPFVRCYSFREFDTGGADMHKPFHAQHEIVMVFFFKSLPIHLKDPQTGQIIKTPSNVDLTGLGTQYNGEMTLNGSYTFFEIFFRPNGFHKIFGIPSQEVTNHIVHANEIFDKQVVYLFEQLCEAKDLMAMGILADAYLLSILKRQKSPDHKDNMTLISNLIVKNPGLLNVAQLAYTANMCVRNFERQFAEQVGMSPKLFCSVVRFNQGLDLKLRSPTKDWTSIAFECGYFDQMHLIKDFKRFSGNAPATFLKQTPLAKETFTSRIEL